MGLHQLHMHVISDDNYFYDIVSQTTQMAERHVEDFTAAATNQVPIAHSLKKLTKTMQTQVNIATYNFCGKYV